MRVVDATEHVARLYNKSPLGTRLIIGAHDLRHAAVKHLPQAVPALTAITLNGDNQACRGADGTWRLPMAALKVAVTAAWGAGKLRLNGGEEGGAFLLAVHLLRQASGVTVPDADLIMAVGLAMWGAIEQRVTECRDLPPVPHKRTA